MENVMGIAAELTDEQVVERARTAVRLALEKQKALDVPIIFCDPKSRKIYKMFADGRMVEVDVASLKMERLKRMGLP